MKTLRINQLNFGKVKDKAPSSVFFYPGYLSGLELASFFTEEENMLQSWVDRSRGRFVVKTGKVTPYGFTDVKKTDTFNSLEEANAKAKLCNYIFDKCKKVGVSVLLVALLYTNAFAFTTEASYYTVASCKREGTSGIMANGKELKDDMLICASWDYAFGTRLLVRNLANNRTVEVVVSDRGPAKRLYRKGRRIDLSLRAFRAIADSKQGIIQVSVEEVK